MSAGRIRCIRRASGLILAAGVLMLALPAAPASAQGFFEAIFGGLRRIAHAPMPSSVSSYADPYRGMIETINPRTETGPASAYCVRTCDGFYFPVRAHAGASSAEMCKSFCPASQTAIYSGSGIDRAVAGDGKRYSDLDNAFVYRQRLVAGCTCNGKNAFGLASIDVANDPTIRPGDIVATKNGLAAATGSKNRAAEFTPIDSYRGFSKSYRDKLGEIKVRAAHQAAR